MSWVVFFCSNNRWYSPQADRYVYLLKAGITSPSNMIWLDRLDEDTALHGWLMHCVADMFGSNISLSILNRYQWSYQHQCIKTILISTFKMQLILIEIFYDWSNPLRRRHCVDNWVRRRNKNASNDLTHYFLERKWRIFCRWHFQMHFLQ